MGLLRKFVGLVVVATHVVGAWCHGMLAEPRARNVVHNSNYCPHCLAAGGPGVTYAGGRTWPRALHGVCGDPHTGPLDHEAGGKFATKIITGKYVQGQTITIRIKITAPHGGRFSFGVCPVPDGATDSGERAAVTQTCFDNNKLVNVDDGTPHWWFGHKASGEYTMQFKLPPAVTCKRCVLQWHYETGNSCTIPGTPPQHVISADMVSCDKTSAMEEFWNCADVSIRPGAPGEDTQTTQRTQKERFENYPHDVTHQLIGVLALAFVATAIMALPFIVAAGVGACVVVFLGVYWATRPRALVSGSHHQPVLRLASVPPKLSVRNIIRRSCLRSCRRPCHSRVGQSEQCGSFRSSWS